MSGAFSKSKQVSDSSSQSIQVGGNASTSFGVGGSTSLSDALSSSQSGQKIAFSDLFEQLFGGANAAAKSISTSGLSSAADTLFKGGTNFLDTLNNASDNTARDAQLDALKTNLGSFFNEQLIPGIDSAGIATGTLGGSRDAVAKSMAAKAVAGQFATGAASILSADQQNKTQAAAVGLGSLKDLYGLAQGGATTGLLPYQLLAQIMGGPTVLGESTSSSVAKAISDSFTNQGSQSYGFDFGSSSSTSHGAGSSFGISGGVGFAPKVGG